MDMIAEMSRAGRKRRAGKRYPSGDVVREKSLSPLEAALLQPHRRNAPLDMQDHALAETPFGCLSLIGAITGEEYRAGIRFAKIVRRYRVVISAPKPDATSIAGAMEPKGRSKEIEDAADRTADYNGSFEALSEAGHTATVVVSRVVVQGEPVPHLGFSALLRGLRLLREHFELTDRAKSVSGVGK